MTDNESACRYSGKVAVPDRARVLDFVLSDANRQVWDNNRNQDFHTAVTVRKDRAAFAEEEYRRLLDSNHAADTDEAHRAGAAQPSLFWRCARACDLRHMVLGIWLPARC
jgi:Starch/carbohydrate-binding module (family 53)